MPQSQLKTKIKTRVWTRQRLMLDTAQKFLNIPRAYGRNMSFWDKNLEMMFRNQMIVGLEVVAHNDAGEPCGGIVLKIDWDEHSGQIMSFGDEVDMTEIAEGATFSSIEDALKLLKSYFDGVCKGLDPKKISMWFSLNPAEVEKYGEQKLYKMIDYTESKEREEANDAMQCKIEKAKASGRVRDTMLADIREMRCGAWAAGVQ